MTIASTEGNIYTTEAFNEQRPNIAGKTIYIKPERKLELCETE